MSNYIEKNIIGIGETIEYAPKKSRIPLFWTWVGGILFCWVLLIPLINAIKVTIEFNAREYVVTNKKIIEKFGVFHTHCDEMQLKSVENITINKTFGGKLFHYGNICIQGTNRNNVNFRGIVDPEGARKAINATIEKIGD